MRTYFLIVLGAGSKEESLEEYRFLCSTLGHHAGLGSVIVLDTTLPEWAKVPKRLPVGVTWKYEPVFGAGWKFFQERQARERAIRIAQHFNPEVLVSVDVDEFFAKETFSKLEAVAKNEAIAIDRREWYQDGKPYKYGDPGDWHVRLFPGSAPVTMSQNLGWQKHPNYNGNPDMHPFPSFTTLIKTVRIQGPHHHHLTKAVGRKNEFKGVPVVPWWGSDEESLHIEWPVPLRRWREENADPISVYF